MSFVGVSATAPAKVILYGEHSVVHGATAIGCAVDLYTIAKLTPIPDPIVILDFQAINQSLTLDVSDVLLGDEGIKRNVDKSFLCAQSLLVYANDIFDKVVGLNVTVTSDIPIGAGLGSSASFAIALCTAFAALVTALEEGPTLVEEGILADLKLHRISQMAVEFERTFHGKPSGIDTCIVFAGGIIQFSKANGGEKIAQSLPVKIVIVDTEVTRRTADVVRKTEELKERHSEIFEVIIDAMSKVAQSAAAAIAETDEESSDKASKLIELAKMNHGLLTTLGVSHPSLEAIKMAVEDFEVGFKLTGAGCGGNAIILVPEHVSVDEVIGKVKEAGFPKAFAATAGGSGFKISVMRE